MNKTTQCKAISLAALLVCAMAFPASAGVIINGGFESGFSGWTRADQVGSDGTFSVQSGTSSPVNLFTVPAPPQGSYAAMTDAGSGGSHVLYQDFVVPNSVPVASIRFSLFVNSGDNFYIGPGLDWAATNQVGDLNLNQQARVDILTSTSDPFSTAAADVLQNLFQTNPGDPLVSGYSNYQVDITALLQARQGQTLRLRFAEVDNVSFFNLGVDDVDITTSAVPEPATWALSAGALLGLAALRRRRN